MDESIREGMDSVVDLKYTDVLIGDVSEVVDHARSRHPHNPIIVIHGCNSID